MPAALTFFFPLMTMVFLSGMGASSVSLALLFLYAMILLFAVWSGRLSFQ